MNSLTKSVHALDKGDVVVQHDGALLRVVDKKTTQNYEKRDYTVITWVEIVQEGEDPITTHGASESSIGWDQAEDLTFLVDPTV